MVKKTDTPAVVKTLDLSQIESLGLIKPGSPAKTLCEINGCPKGSDVEVVAVEDEGKVYRVKFTSGPKSGHVIRVEWFSVE